MKIVNSICMDNETLETKGVKLEIHLIPQKDEKDFHLKTWRTCNKTNLKTISQLIVALSNNSIRVLTP